MNSEEKILKILKEIEEISEFLCQPYDESSPDNLNKHLTKLNGFLARLPALESEAEYLKGDKKGNVADAVGKELTATVFREKIQGETAIYDKTYKFVYRLNQNIIEIQRGVISQLSYHKSMFPREVNTEVLDKVERLTRNVKKLEMQLNDKL